MNNNNDLDILSIVSVLLGLQNLQENRQQSAHNDVQTANDRQAAYMLQEINKRFDEQNELLKRLIKLLEK